MTGTADPRTISRGADRWLTDSRVYNLVWLGRWIERTQTIARVVRWAAVQDASGSPGSQGGGQHDIESVLRMAAGIRGLSVGRDETALDLLLTRDSAASLRGCLAAARFNATHVAPVEVMQVLGEAIETVQEEGPGVSDAGQVVAFMDRLLPILDRLHTAIEESWFHSAPLSEEEVYRRFVQQQ